MVSLKENPDGSVTVTALHAGSTTVHYTVGWENADITLTISSRVMPQTGQDFGPVFLLLVLAGCTLAGTLLIYKKEKEKL